MYNTITNFRPIYFSFCGNLKVIFEIEVSKMCNLKTKIIPVVTGAMGMIKKWTQNFIDQIPGKPSLQEM